MATVMEATAVAVAPDEAVTHATTAFETTPVAKVVAVLASTGMASMLAAKPVAVVATQVATSIEAAAAPELAATEAHE